MWKHVVVKMIKIKEDQSKNTKIIIIGLKATSHLDNLKHFTCLLLYGAKPTKCEIYWATPLMADTYNAVIVY